MDISKAINAIETLINSLHSKNELERLHTFSSIKTLLDMLLEHAKKEEEDGNPIPNVGMYVHEFYMPLECLVGLDDFGKPEDQYFVWLMTSISKLQSVHCFNLK